MAVITFTLGNEAVLPVGVLLGLSAGFLLYIAMSDVIPTIHRNSTDKIFGWQPVLLLVGALVVGAAINVSHAYIDTDHGHANEDSSQIHVHDELDQNHE